MLIPSISSRPGRLQQRHTRKRHKKNEHRHPRSNQLLVHPGSCLLHRRGNQLRKSWAQCMKAQTISNRTRHHIAQGAEESSSGVGTPSSGAGALPQGSGDSSSRATPFISHGDATNASPGIEPSTSTGVAPDAPHHEAAITRSNPSVEEPLDSTHAKGASGQIPRPHRTPIGIYFGFRRRKIR